MSGSNTEICVLTFAVDRPRELARCIASVAAQIGAPRLRHRILSERAEELRNDPHLTVWRDRVEWHTLEGVPFEGSSSPRVARLRDAAIRQVDEPLLCFLDDDNEFAPGHLASLYALLQQEEYDAVHSWRTVLNMDGSPFPFSHYPWHNNAEIAGQMYAWCVDNGVIVPGDPVMRDGALDVDHDNSYATVDMNEWLFRTAPLCRVGFDSQFSTGDLRLRVGEDDKLYRRMLACGMRIASSKQPTVRYYLGGVSNLRLTSGPTVDA